MRRLIHNTTAIAACLSLIAPHLAVAQNAEPLQLAQSEGQPENPADELLKKQRAEEKARKQAERAAAKEAAREAAAQQEEQPKKRQRDEERPEQAERKKAEERPERAERQREEERPEPAKREKAEERPKQAERQREGERPEAAKREKAEARPKQAEPQAEEEAREPAARETTEPRREKAERQEGETRPERAERETFKERPQAAEREQQEERPKPRKAEANDAPAEAREDRKPKGEAKRDAGDRPSEDDLSKALAAEEAARDGKAEPRKEAERKETGREDAKREDGGKRSEDRPAKRDDTDLGKALAAEEAGRKATRDEDRKAEEDRPKPRKEREDRAAAEQDRNADQDRVERALREDRQDDQDRPRDRAERRERDETESERRAARETRADTSAAALREDRRGEISEERVTRANSRSSSEDFETNLRDAMDERDSRRREREAEARREDDDDDKKDLAKALLLGLGAVAVGSMLANNSQVALSSPDRLVVTRPDGSQELIKDDVALLRQPGSTVTTENFDDGSSRTIVTRADGSKVVTIRDADLRVLRRSLVSPDGRVTQLIDDTQEVAPVDIASLPRPVSRPYTGSITDEDALREALRREVDVDRRFTLGQIRNIPEVRSLVSPISIDAITFESGSAAISPDQASQLSGLGHVIQDAIADNPREMFLIEGHTDAVGRDAMNLALSDRRAESVALALSEYYDVPAENLVVQGYGEQFLQVQSAGDERENRRAAVRRITDLLQTAKAQ